MVRPNTTPPPLLSLRTAVILSLSAIGGVGGGVLTHLSGQNLAEATIAACGAIAASVTVLHQIIANPGPDKD